jgi:REP element-mobilizing transposase RayT
MSEKYKVREHGWPYFVTFTVERWIDVYTREIYRGVFVDSLNYCIQNKGLVVHAWVLMTNHAHLLINSTDCHRIEDFVRDFKRHTAKMTFKMIQQNTIESRDWMAYMFLRSGSFNAMNKDFQFWRNGYHPIHCWKDELIQQKIRYIHENPVRAGHVEHAEDWKYSSAKHYATGQGMVKIEPLLLF